MDYPSNITFKVESDDLEYDRNGAFQHLLFHVDVKIEKEKEESDWCVGNSEGAGDLLEPLFFKEVHDASLHQCALCSRYFNDWFALLQHNLAHLRVTVRNLETFPCDRCSSLFTSKLKFKQHIRECVHRIYNLGNRSKTYFLTYKPKAYKPINEVAEKDKSRYGKIYVPKLKESLKDIPENATDEGNTNTNVQAVIKDVTNQNDKSKTQPKDKSQNKSKMPHECNFCGKTYSYKHWHAHMQSVHGNGGYICGICNMEFKCERYFTRHMKKKHIDGPGNVGKVKKKVERVDIQCDECETILNSRYALTTHKRNVHSTGDFICSICKSKLKCRSYLLTHMKRVHYNDGKQHACECGKKFKSPRYLKVHKKYAHSKK